MGSFHSKNVDDLMAQSDNVYTAPDLPFEPVTLPADQDDFLLDRVNWTFINHGAFGAALRVGYIRAEQWRLHLEHQPLRYFDRDLLPHLVESTRQLAAFCNAPREATTLIPNVTYGLNTVLRGYTRTFSNDAHIILWDTSYGSLKKMARQLSPRVTEIPVSKYFAQWKDSTNMAQHNIFLHAMQEILDGMSIDDTKNALLVIDHTTSNTALNMPLKTLSKLGKEHNMLVMVDGAHGLLAQQLDLSALPNVDFYLANGHKWLSCPRGVGVMYCPSTEWRETILEEPAVMSHGLGEGYHSRFLWDGCRDYAAALSVPAVLDHWKKNGISTIQKEIQSKLRNAVAILGQAWHGREDDVTLAPLDVHAPMMALVLLPKALQGNLVATSEDAKRIQDYLFDQSIEVPIKCIEGILYVRISCHVYNEISEYKRLANVLTQYGELYKQG